MRKSSCFLISLLAITGMLLAACGGTPSPVAEKPTEAPAATEAPSPEPPTPAPIAEKTERELAPGALLVNFTNPAGLVTEVLSRHCPHVPAVGVRNVPIITKMEILEGLEKQGYQIDPQRAELKTLGLNHLSWHYGFLWG